jgi:hypothetical protein
MNWPFDSGLPEGAHVSLSNSRRTFPSEHDRRGRVSPLSPPDWNEEPAEFCYDTCL